MLFISQVEPSLQFSSSPFTITAGLSGTNPPAREQAMFDWHLSFPPMNLMVAGMVSGQGELQGTKHTPFVSQFLLGLPIKDCIVPSYGLKQRHSSMVLGVVVVVVVANMQRVKKMFMLMPDKIFFLMRVLLEQLDLTVFFSLDQREGRFR